MPMEEHTIIHDIGRLLSWSKEYWYLIGGLVATLWGALLMVKRNWLAGYATKEEMNDCHANLQGQIMRNRELNTKEHGEIIKIIIDRIDK